MIQRIQTVFLILAAISGFCVLAFPFATTPEQVTTSTLFSDATFNVKDSIALLILFVLAGLLSLAGVFLYKNRELQMKVTRFGIIANIIGLVLAVLLFWQDIVNLGNVEPSDGLGTYLPFILLICGILALRFIRKDENLVRSMDRLR